MLGLPNFVFYLIVGALGAFGISLGRTLGEKIIPQFPDMPLLYGEALLKGKGISEHKMRVVGRSIHLATGALWGLFYGLLTDNQIFFAQFNLIQGVLFSIIPWLFLMVVLLPFVGGGFFGMKINSYRWLTALVLHIVFGIILGYLLAITVGGQY
jgi:hypothetical protein